MTQVKDDLEAVRAVADTLEPFTNEERERIIRWACEKLGMAAPAGAGLGAPQGSPMAPLPKPTVQSQFRDIRSFIQEKDPKNDSQLAAVVAFYHQFVAPENERKDAITSTDLIEACRQSDRVRPSRPAQTLVNAYGQGLLNRGEQGQYSINSVGENLVAMVLPDEGGDSGARRTANRRSAPKKASRKKAGKKKAASKKKAKKKAKKKSRRKPTR